LARRPFRSRCARIFVIEVQLDLAEVAREAVLVAFRKSEELSAPSHPEGRFAIVTNVESGMRWTRLVSAQFERRRLISKAGRARGNSSG